jgi:hypothetical protein
MVEFCPDCGNLLRNKPCPCGYKDQEITPKKMSLGYIREPPSANIIYCRITATPFDKLKMMLSKGVYLEKLKEIRFKLKKNLYSCLNCVYYHEEDFLCKPKNKYLRKDSICKSFEPFEES